MMNRRIGQIIMSETEMENQTETITNSAQEDGQMKRYCVRCYDSYYMDVYTFAEDENQARELAGAALDDETHTPEWDFDSDGPEIYQSYECTSEKLPVNGVGVLVLN